MLPATISLETCTVVFKKWLDRFISIFPARAPLNYGQHLTSMFMMSGALVQLYNQMTNGTVVKIGQGPRKYSTSRIGKHRSSRRNKSWFLSSLWGKRKCCTEAIYKMAESFSDYISTAISEENFDDNEVIDEVMTISKCSQTDTKDLEQKKVDSIKKTVSDDKMCNSILHNTKKSLIHAGGDYAETERWKRRRRRKTSEVKRLGKSKLDFDLTVSQSKRSNKFQTDCCKRTRSGTVYSPYS